MDFEEKKRRFINEVKRQSRKEEAITPLDRFLWKLGVPTKPYFMWSKRSLFVFTLVEAFLLSIVLTFFLQDLPIFSTLPRRLFFCAAFSIPFSACLAFLISNEGKKRALPRWE